MGFSGHARIAEGPLMPYVSSVNSKGGAPFGEDMWGDPRAAVMISLARPAWPALPAVERDLRPLPAAPLRTESTFYGRYAWCLDIFPTVREVSHRLREELSRQGETLEDWQREEVAVNAFMLSSALTDAVDDYLAGESYDLSPAAVLPGLRAG